MRMSKQCLVQPKKFVKTITDHEVKETIKKDQQQQNRKP